jgi:hypothetical protein
MNSSRDRWSLRKIPVKALVVVTLLASLVLKAVELLEVTVMDWLEPKPVEVNFTDLLSVDSVACTPAESWNWLTAATTAELLVELANESCTVPVLPAMETVAAPLRPVEEPRKFNWPVWADATTLTETESVLVPTLAELIETAVKAEVVERPEVL